MFIALGSEANSLVFHEISAVFLGGNESLLSVLEVLEFRMF